ncbi:conserved hypothetical protein [Luminiphilus syltensis NOR5-1B]|uniref:Uncharacterized protein n=1 Tax=Luminiphilus syltensis NOR5-1B TaxID=565045 RepID=B8KVY1_9GAMM|nr:conserved hypothetical protein [Luminiphilus syltensis NOR5-1B]
MWKPAFKEAGVVFCVAAVVLVAVYSLWFFDFHPEFEPFAGHDVETAVIPGKAFQPLVAGGGFLDGDTGVITAFAEGQAILSMPINFLAEDFPFIKFNIEGITTWANAAVYWRRADEPELLYNLPLNQSWGELTQVAMVYGKDKYRGRIIELAIGFHSDPTDHDNNGEPIRMNGAELRPFSAAAVAEQIFEDWTNPPLWGGWSNNIVRGIHAAGMVYPNLVANLLVVTGLLVAGLWRLGKKLRKKAIPSHRLLATALCLCLMGWVFNDALRWHWRIAQLADTHERYAGLPLEERIRNNPIRCGRRDDCFEHLLPYF